MFMVISGIFTKYYVHINQFSVTYENCHQTSRKNTTLLKAVIVMISLGIKYQVIISKQMHHMPDQMMNDQVLWSVAIAFGYSYRLIGH